ISDIPIKKPQLTAAGLDSSILTLSVTTKTGQQTMVSTYYLLVYTLNIVFNLDPLFCLISPIDICSLTSFLILLKEPISNPIFCCILLFYKLDVLSKNGSMEPITTDRIVLPIGMVLPIAKPEAQAFPSKSLDSYPLGLVMVTWLRFTVPCSNQFPLMKRKPEYIPMPSFFGFSLSSNCFFQVTPPKTTNCCEKE